MRSSPSGSFSSWRDDADLQAADRRQKAGGRQRTQIVGLGKQLGTQAELHVGFPIAAGYRLAHARDVKLALRSGRRCRRSARCCREGFRQNPDIAPARASRARRMRKRRASAQACSWVSSIAPACMISSVSSPSDLGEIGGGDIARRGRRGLAGVRIDRRLVGGLPADRLDALALPARIHLRRPVPARSSHRRFAAPARRRRPAWRS